MKSVYLVSGLDVKRFDSEGEILIRALKKRDIVGELVCWDDPEVDWGKPDLVIVKSASDYAWKRNSFLHWAKNLPGQNRLWNHAQVLEWNSGKNYLLQLQKAGIPMPPTILIERETGLDLGDLLRDKNWCEIVVKPTVSVGSLGLRRFKQGDPEAEKHCVRITRDGFTDSVLGTSFTFPPCDALVQPFVPDIFSTGEASLIFFGGKLSHSVIKKVKPGDFRAHPGFGATVNLYDASGSEVKCAQDAMSLAPIKPEYARIDMIPGVDGPLLLEMELIEPWLFFPLIEGSVENFADHISSSL